LIFNQKIDKKMTCDYQVFFLLRITGGSGKIDFAETAFSNSLPTD